MTTHSPRCEATDSDTVDAVELCWRPGGPFCLALRPRLRRAGFPLREVNIWTDPHAAARLRQATGGDETVPTVFIGDTALVNPSLSQVRAAVHHHAPHLLTEGNTTMATTGHAHQPATITTRAAHGGLAGLGGGIVFGMMMAMMGMLTAIAGLVGANSPIIGGIIHLILSIAFGIVFAAVITTHRAGQLLGWGAAYGVVLWIIGGQLLLPARLGMPIFPMDMTGMQKLIGHLVFGLVTAAILWGIRRRTAR